MHRWDGIDEFVAVARAGSFSGGAQSLGSSTSRVSRAVARLEVRLDTPLFYRTTRRVSLTEAGRALVERFSDLITQRDNAFGSMGGNDEPQGELRLTCSAALGSRFVAPIVARMLRDHPKVSVTMELNNRVSDVVAGGFDLAIRTGTLTDSRLIATRIASRRHYLCASPDYLDRAGRPHVVDDLSRFDCVVGVASSWHFEEQGTARTFRPSGRWRCDSGEAVLQAAMAGVGICQLPEFYVLPALSQGLLVPLLEDCRAGDEPIWAVYPQRRHLLPNVRHLVGRLKKELGPALRHDER